MPPRARALLLSIVSIALLGTAAPEGAAASTPNGSILFWGSGNAVTGTLVDGVFSQKATYPLKGVSLAAAGRDSLALYTRSTGRLRTGRFRQGIYTRVEWLALPKGYSHMIASCDTLLLYNTATGKAMSGSFLGGRLRNRRAFTLPKGLTRMAASCDSAWLWGPTVVPDIRLGLLTEGRWTRTSSLSMIAPNARLGGTADSLVNLDGTGGGRWGRLLDGAYQNKGTASDFAADWSVVAGTATTMLFYRSSDGYACGWTMDGGAPTAADCSVTFPAGWRGIAGGK